VRTCAACGVPLPLDSTSRRRFCSEVCRSAAWRRRRAAAHELEPAAAIAQVMPAPVTFADPDEQVAAALLEAWRIVGALSRLGREARPTLAWRCEKVAGALRAALVEHFGEL